MRTRIPSLQMPSSAASNAEMLDSFDEELEIELDDERIADC